MKILLLLALLAIPARHYGFDLLGDEESECRFDLVGSEPVKARSRQIWLFTASWCGPCRQFKSQRERLIKAGWEFGDLESGAAHIREVDVDRNPQLWKEMAAGVPYIPAFVLVVDGRPVQTVTGYRTAEQVAAMYSKEVEQ